jgi:hypothetical protein
MKLAASTDCTRFKRFFVQRECIPLPGPPEEKDEADPSRIRKI